MQGSTRSHEIIRIRQWERLIYHNPKHDLIAFALLNDAVASSSLSPTEKALRGREQKSLSERRQAALFAWGLMHLCHIPNLEFARVEHEDYDAVFRWQQDESTICYRPIQLKELVGKRWNPVVTLDEVVSGLKKYGDSSDLTIGIYLNRADLTVETIFKVPSYLRIGGLFVFGACLPDCRKWMILGDCLKPNIEHLIYGYPIP